MGPGEVGFEDCGQSASRSTSASGFADDERPGDPDLPLAAVRLLIPIAIPASFMPIWPRHPTVENTNAAGPVSGSTRSRTACSVALSCMSQVWAREPLSVGQFVGNDHRRAIVLLGNARCCPGSDHIDKVSEASDDQSASLDSNAGGGSQRRHLFE